MKISNKVYDALSLISRIFLPISTFISAVLIIWKVPYAEQITATLAAIDTALGAIVVKLRSSYKKQIGEK